MANIRILSSAEHDIADALNWYNERSALAAERLELEIDAAIVKIAASPVRFPKLDANHHYVLLKRFPFYIAYRVEQSDVLIIAVRHASRSE